MEDPFISGITGMTMVCQIILSWPACRTEEDLSGLEPKRD